MDVSDQDEIKVKQRSVSAEKRDMKLSQKFDVGESDDKVVKIGVCCMEKKAQSNEMQAILERINVDLFKVIIFPEKMIMEDPVEQWPIVDCLMSFYSWGFPLGKAIAYVDFRKPMMINDVRKQQVLWDRKRVYTMMRENNIPVPRHYFVIKNTDRDIVEEYNAKEQLVKLTSKRVSSSTQVIEEEEQDSLSLLEENMGKLQTKISSDSPDLQDVDSHEVLRRPQSSKTSHHQLRSFDARQLNNLVKAKSKLTQIEEFDDYVLIDGQKLVKPFVEKPFDGEDHNIYIYYNSNEGGGCKKLFRKVGNQSSSFDPNQNSIRNDGNNYIYEAFIPTNGFDIKVYTVGEFFAHAEARKSPVLDGKVLRTQNGKEMRYPICLTPEEKLMATKIVNVFGQNVCGFDLLRCNGKSFVCDVNGWSFVKGNPKYYEDCATVLQQMILRKLRPRLLQDNSFKFMRNFLKNSFRPSSTDLEQDTGDTQELRSVVAIFRHGDRTPKQKMKMKSASKLFLAYFEDQKDQQKEIKLKHPKELIKFLEITRECIQQCNDNNIIKLLQLKSVLEKGGHFEGINRKVQMRPIGWDQSGKPNQLLIVLKWGGELTQLGENHAVQLGQLFRNNMYPTEKDGLLRLHSTYRHDLKTYSSDEGRCQNTAAAFLKGFLGYEGEVTPILASMVIKNQTAQKLLDCNVQLEKLEQDAKESLSAMMQSEENILEQFKKKYPQVSLTEQQRKVLSQFGTPILMLQELHSMIKRLTHNIRHYLNLQKDYYIKPEDMNYPEHDETLTLFYKRWYKLDYDFKQQGTYNISKIPDIYDSIKYDILHNFDKITQFYKNPKEFFDLAELLCSFMVPFEYGITDHQRLDIGKEVVSPLCEKIMKDLLWWKFQENHFDEDYWKYRQNDDAEFNSPWRHVRTRLYFTSASHMYSLFNVLYYGLGHYLIEDQQKQRQLEKLNMLQYLSNIVIKLYEDLSTPKDDINRFRLEVSVNDGCQLIYPPNPDPNHLPISENIHINQSLRMEQLEGFLNQIINLPIS